MQTQLPLQPALSNQRNLIATVAYWSLGVTLSVSLIVFVYSTRHWPIVGDASLYHYVAFLMDHGFAPYRQIVEINMPGSYLAEWLIVHTFGGGPIAWRVFDFTLMAGIGAAMILIARPYGWFAGFAAGGVFTLIHGQDGVAFPGERDLIMTALLAWACALLILSWRRQAEWLAGVAALCAGLASTIKPLTIAAGVALVVLAILHRRSQQTRSLRVALYGCAGLLLPLLAVYAWLLHEHAAGAFMATMLGLTRYYNGMYRRPLGFLLRHSISPIGALVLLWLPLIFTRWQGNWERRVVAGGVIFGLFTYCGQARGFPYHRYPLLCFLLLLMALDFMAAFRRPVMRYFAAAAAVYALLILAPQSALKAARFDWRNQEFITMLSGDLRDLGGPKLSGGVQCLDTIAGCINTLYRDQLVQATGFIYDCYAYAPRGAEMMGTIDRYRADFMQAIEQNPPRVFVVTNQYCQTGPDGYGKLARWPEMNALLATHYHLYAERMPPHDIYWWNRTVPPSGYRIYIRQ